MALYFRNSTNRTLWIVYAYYSPGCPGVTWAKQGWYKNLPENTVNVRSGFAGGQTFFYFAHDDAGREWSGEFFTQVPSNAFEWCWDVGSTTARTVGGSARLALSIPPLRITPSTSFREPEIGRSPLTVTGVLFPELVPE